MPTDRTEYQRNYMRDWRAKNPTSRVGKLEAVLRRIAETTCEAETWEMAEGALRDTNLSGASYDRDGRFGG